MPPAHPFARPLAIAGALLVSAAAAGTGLPPAPPAAYYSFGKPADAGDFRTCIRTFKNPYTEDTVVLMGTVHLAEASLYARLNAEIDRADLVLIEGVTGSPGLGTLPLLYQSGMASRLIAPARLATQHDQVPADAPQCQNADVDLSALSPGWGSTLRSLITLPVVVVVGESMVLLQSAGDYAARLTGNGGAYAAWHREVLATSLAQSDSDDMENADLIITKRNEVVLRHLDTHVAEDVPGRVLIPWGAAHGPGLEQGLLARGYEPVAEEWITAVGVHSYERSGYMTPDHAFHFHLPLVFSVRGSDTTLAHSGPLWLWSYAEAPAGNQTSLGWVCYNRMDNARGDANTSAFAGLAYLSESREGRYGSLWLAGLLRYAEGSTQEKTTYEHHLVGLHARESDPDRTRVRLGWWGALYDRTEKTSGDADLSILPHIFGRPLLYDSKTVNGATRRRFLLFFEI